MREIIRDNGKKRREEDNVGKKSDKWSCDEK